MEEHDCVFLIDVCHTFDGNGRCLGSRIPDPVLENLTTGCRRTDEATTQYKYKHDATARQYLVANTVAVEPDEEHTPNKSKDSDSHTWVEVVNTRRKKKRNEHKSVVLSALSRNNPVK